MSASRAERRREITQTRRAAREAARDGHTPAADGSSAALELIQAVRAGATTEELGARVVDVMRRLLDAHPGDYATACAWLIGQLATQAARRSGRPGVPVRH